MWWDAKCLPPGKPWEEGFADGLFGCDVFVPFLSKAALASFASLSADSRCDNVLLEYRLALELKARGELRGIFPVFVGDLKDIESLGMCFGDFFKGGGAPKCPDVVVASVEAKAIEHLQSAGKPPPAATMTVAEVQRSYEGRWRSA